MPEAGRRYWAFVSYSHEDARWGRWLHRQLEAYAVPRAMVGTPTPAGPAPRHFRPSFRDRDELGAAARLGDQLRQALRDAAWLIVVCSPAAARSKWVAEEIRAFKATHGEDRVLAVIVAGEPFASDDPLRADQECFPEPLRSRLEADGAVGGRIEPTAADLRPGKDGRRGALLKLLAGMLGTDLDRLVQRDLRRRHQRLTMLTAASVAISAVLAGLAVVALQERNEAIAQRGQAEGLIEFMVGDLRRTLEPAGRLDALDAIGGRALTYYAAQRSHGLDAESLGRRARVLHMLGSIRSQRGDLPGALALFRQADDSTGELLARSPRNPGRIYDHAQSAYWVGYVAFERGQDDVALGQWRKYEQLAEELVSIDPKNQDWRAEVGSANMDLGAVMFRDGRADDAVAAYARALAIGRSLAASPPERRDRQWDVADTYEWLADAEVRRGRLDAALADRAAAGAIYKRLVSRAPGDNAAIAEFAHNQAETASILMSRGALSDAIGDLQASAAEEDRLIAAAPDNADYKAKASQTRLLLGQALLDAGQMDAAAGIAGKVLEMSESQARRNQGIVWAGAALGGARVLSMRIAAARAPSAADQKAPLQPAPAEAARLEGLSRAHPHSVPLALLAAEAALLAGDYEKADGGAPGARAWWAEAGAPLARAGVAGAAGGRSAILLRQRAYRLSYGRPPEGPLEGSGGSAGPSTRPRGKGRTDYQW